MSGGEARAGIGGSEMLDAPDLMAAHVMEARALRAQLPADRGDNLLVLIDALLFEIGRLIAAELPRPSDRARAWDGVRAG